ncbi:hypothetical protein K491DRAFT_604113 [Lophiostoma macrostomum CBS 122681]|uniref:Linalool dehydratase/isomerase domain-containing protein n=1 Tax=Lophiostoma macrostomum CBS 122681 TaxID=1314788 RepID=A0A6A6SYM9_9PLEO|nr:hypothetical protein K491DRAFT_604113 [Lophiostoma macrostomum CBS 122681]
MASEKQPSLSNQLGPDLSNYPTMNKQQAGHVRHFLNLVSQADGSWDRMGALEGMQEFNDAYRYQLATMAYAVANTHFHRTPALRSVYKPLFRRIIHKMLRRDVWGYWFLTSHSGKLTEPDRTELRKPWADPVKKENIMYSGHLLLMTSLYAMLFDDDEFEKPNSLVFKWDPLFWGLGTETYSYDNRTLQKVILKEMEQNNWVGVCCEPNLVFVVCNQFPIIAVRYNDIRDGTNHADEVIKQYRAAWDAKGMVFPNGMFADMLMLKQDLIFPQEGAPYGAQAGQQIGFTAWANAFMNAWNSDLVWSLFDKQALGHITRTKGKYRLHPTNVAHAFRHLVSTRNADPASEETLEQALRESQKLPLSPVPFHPPTYGVVCQWLSELGKTEELEDLLGYADTNLNPTWENGGLYYPREDEQQPDSADITFMEPFSGNAAIGYGRLNVHNGQKIMWERPWTKELLSTRPYLDGMTMSNGVDYLRGGYDEAKQMLFFTATTWNGVPTMLNPVARNLASGDWAVYVDRQFKEVIPVEEGGSLTTEVRVADVPVDVVFIRTRTQQ